MFERFTDQARNVPVVALEEAQLMRHGQIGTEHLLVALAEIPALGLTRQRARAEVVKIVGVGEAEPIAQGTTPFTDAAKAALDASVHEAMKLGHTQVEPEHILLGILRQRDSVALRVLGTGPRELREAVIRDLGAPPDGALAVRIGPEVIGDLGNPRTDARVLAAMLERNGPIAAWLRERGVAEDAVRRLL